MTGAFLPYTRHTVDEADIAAVAEVLRSDFLTGGPQVERLEATFTQATGARFAVACSSGTAALHLALLALGLGPGDVAIVPSVTFLATANAVRYVGAEVEFADVDPLSGLMTPASLAEALSRRPEAKAALPVHLAGQCADMEEIAALATRHGLTLVEDACHALGGVAQGEVAGACGRSAATCFSLHPAKIVAMGEGGVVTTNDGGVDARLRRLRNHGLERDPAAFEIADQAFDPRGRPNPWYYELPYLGYNYRASDIQCALGVSQMVGLAASAERRRAICAHYDRLLGPLAPLVRPIARMPANMPAWHLYPVLIDFAALGRDRAEVMDLLKRKGIGSQVHYIPVHRQPYYRRRYGLLDRPGADHYYDRALSLPMYVGLCDGDVERVVSALTEIVGQ